MPTRIGRLAPRVPRQPPRGTTVQLAGLGSATAEVDAHAGLPWSDAHPAPEAPVDMASQELRNVGTPLADGSGARRIDVDTVDDALAAHEANVSNPHGTTAAQTGAIANDGGTPSVLSGLAANRPAAGVAGRLYLSTDTFRIDRDTGVAWQEIARAPSQIGAADMGFDPATQLELNVVDDALAAHEANVSNPHGVTAAQAGAAPAVHDHDSRHPRYIQGSYVGDNVSNRLIAVAFRPKFLIIQRRDGHASAHSTDLAESGRTTGQRNNGGAFSGYSILAYADNASPYIEAAGFRVGSTAEMGFNVNGATYDYIAYR